MKAFGVTKANQGIALSDFIKIFAPEPNQSRILKILDIHAAKTAKNCPSEPRKTTRTTSSKHMTLIEAQSMHFLKAKPTQKNPKVTLKNTQKIGRKQRNCTAS